MELVELIEERKLKKRTRNIYYTCLLILPFISLPWLVINLFSLSRNPDFFELVSAAGMPLLPCVIVTGWRIRDKAFFYSSHAKQALFLLGLHFLSLYFVVWNLEYGDESFAAFLIFFVNGGLWLFGSVWGLGQVRNGRCWWAAKIGRHPPFEMSQRSDFELGREIDALAKRQRQPGKPQPPADARPVQPVQPIKRKAVPVEPPLQVRKEPPAADQQTIEELVEAFRVGDAAARAEAVRKLEALGAIGEF